MNPEFGIELPFVESNRSMPCTIPRVVAVTASLLKPRVLKCGLTSFFGPT
jgi:hypothetical protein